MFDAKQYYSGNGSSARNKYKSIAFRKVQTVPVSSHASVDMEKFLMDVEKCGVRDLIMTMTLGIAIAYNKIYYKF